MPESIFTVLGGVATTLIIQYFLDRRPGREAIAKNESSDGQIVRDLAMTPEKYEALRLRVTNELREGMKDQIDIAVSTAIKNDRIKNRVKFINLKAEIKALRHYIVDIGAAADMSSQVEKLKIQYMKELENIPDDDIY